MIRSFAGRETELVWQGFGPRRLPPDIQNVALRKLRTIDAAEYVDDLRVPGNRLEMLKRDRAVQWSIRIND